MRALTSENIHFLCSKKERVSQRKTKIPANLARWEQGKKAFLKFTEKHFARSTWKIYTSWDTVFAPKIAFLLKISKYFFLFSSSSFSLCPSQESSLQRNVGLTYLLVQVVGHRFCFSSLRWGSSFWSSYQLSCLYTFVFSSKSIIEMKSIFVLPMLLILKVGRYYKGNKKSLESEMETDFSISLSFWSYYTDTEISSMVFQKQKKC